MQAQACDGPSAFQRHADHDFDMARYLCGAEFVSGSVTASTLIYPRIGELGNVDTASVTMCTAGGKICVVTNSRRATYGYDQRIEVRGSLGMVTAENPRIDDAHGDRC